MSTRIAVARLWHEGNSFTPILTRLADFERREWRKGADVADFGLHGILRALGRAETERAIALAKNFKNEMPRASAILTIVGTVLEKPASQSVGTLQ